MPRSNEDEAWRAIVENYGDRPGWTRSRCPTSRARHSPTESDRLPGASVDARTCARTGSCPRAPPPLPRVPRDRMLAWAGLFGSPTSCSCLVAGIDIPPLLGYLLVGAFVGGFLYLVVQMPRGPPTPGTTAPGI